ncbi:MAG: DUF134 domain-containing protein [Methanomicrobiales archaeon]|nr:DUF134 domain-containing protein [Methanomicrobiales archaeon]MDI6875911.1 DUF134 domain-containing protein [Methanomicrobiales archaeon]
MSGPDTLGAQPRRRGRPRINRVIESAAQSRCYEPRCCPNEEMVRILPEELEILRLVDLEGLNQETAAATLGVSRKTAWRDLHEARRKIADALVYGKAIEVAGCARENTELCPKIAGTCPVRGTDPCPWRRCSRDEPHSGT